MVDDTVPTKKNKANLIKGKSDRSMEFDEESKNKLNKSGMSQN